MWGIIEEGLVKRGFIKNAVNSAKKSVDTELIDQSGVTPDTFAKEMHFQVYRIENVLQGFDSNKLAGLKADPSTKALFEDPYLTVFLASVNEKKAGTFIEDAKQKDVLAREKLLAGVRKLIFKASIKKKEDEKGVSEERKEEENAAKELVQNKKLESSDIDGIEKNLAMPFDLKNTQKVGLNKVQNCYMAVIGGQKVFEHYLNSMQTDYKTAISKAEAYNKRHTSGVKRKVFGVFYWGARTVKGWVGGKKGSTKVNEAVAIARQNFDNSFKKLGSIKEKIDARSKEIKEGLGMYKKKVRTDLKDGLSKSDWTKAKEEESAVAKKGLEEKKTKLGAYLSNLGKKDDDISKAKNNASTLNAGLKERYGKIECTEESFESRKKLVEERITQLEGIYGKDSEQVKRVKQMVLLPVLQGRDKIGLIKTNLSEKLTDTEEGSQRLDLLQADLFMEETGVIKEFSTLELEITKKDQEIAKFANTRVMLVQILENMETTYMAVDEFKYSVDSNLDKMTDGNTKVFEDVKKQQESFKNMNVNEPGFFNSVWNTALIGNAGFLGGCKFLANDLPSGIANKVFGADNYEKYTLGTVTGGLYKGVEWLYDGAKNLHKDAYWLTPFTGMLSFGTGILKSGAGIVNGVGMLASSPDVVLTSMDSMWNLKTLKAMVHWDEWSKNPFGALGQASGDVIAMFFTAGAAKASAAATVAKSVPGKNAAWAGGKAFVVEIAKEFVHIPANLAIFAKDIVVGAGSLAQGAWWKLSGKALTDVQTVVVSQTDNLASDVALAAGDLAKKVPQNGPKYQPGLKSVLGDIEKGLSGKSTADLVGIAQKLTAEMALIPGFKASRAADVLNRQLNMLINSSKRLDKINLRINVSANAALKTVEGGKNLTLENIRNAKRATEKQIDDLIGKEKQLEFYKNNPQEKVSGIGQLKDKIRTIDDTIKNMTLDLKTASLQQLKEMLGGKSLEARLKARLGELGGEKGMLTKEIKTLKNPKLLQNEITRIASLKARYIARGEKIGYIFGDYNFIFGGLMKGVYGGNITGILTATLDHFKNYSGQVLKSVGKDVVNLAWKPTKGVVLVEFYIVKKILTGLAKNPIIAIEINNVMKEFNKVEGLYEKKMKLEKKKQELLVNETPENKKEISKIDGEIKSIESQIGKIGKLVETLPDKIELDPKFIEEVKATAQEELANLIKNKDQLKPITIKSITK